mgnify:CR=1 FL=1
MKNFIEIPNGAVPVMLTPFDEFNNINFETIDAMVDFYIDAGVSAIFAVCLSSEMFHLTCNERFQLAEKVVKKVNGRIPVLVSGNFGGTFDEQIISINKMYDTGADAVVVLLSKLPNNDNLPNTLLQLSDKVNIPLGIYECPSPKHIQIAPEEIAQIASSGNYIFMKETSSNLDVCLNKVKAAANTPFKVFIANLRCTPETLKAGGPGHCGIIANVCPEHTSAMCSNSTSDVKHRAYESAQIMHDIMCACDYIPAAKYILTKRGLNMGSRCRCTSNVLVDKAKELLDYTISEFDFLHPLAEDKALILRKRLNEVYPDIT